ncbi:hypothetical protein BB558_004883 [Smittium angustum]|uniref:Replication factor C subunit 1 n=1 Tax=Smittium angustum TaxID=133377 RepID=A0A2U1J236_SMIAN|nr:hypothetical protein BB558_004883 [Smittium angustum]
MIPARLPELYYKIKNRLYPDYFYYAIVALGSAASKRIRTPEEKKQELTYIQKSILASLSVRISKIYQIDLSKITRKKHSEDQLELRRRVFWIFYGFDRGRMSFNGSLPTVQDRDIVVNLPENDFWWRYGGECKVQHPEIIFWNHIANSENSKRFSKEDTKNYVKIRTLSGKVSDFARRRWIKKVYNPDDDNCQLVLLIDKLNKFEEAVVKNPPIDLDLIKEAYPKYKDTIRFTVDIEHILYKNNFTQFHFFMKSVLYQTEMVRIEGIHMHPGRIVSAKNILVETAKKQIDLVYELGKVLPIEYWEKTIVSTGLMSGITSLNYINISPPNDSMNASIKIEYLKEIYHEMENYSEIPIIFLMYLDRLSKFINKTHKENEKYNYLFGKMKEYSIDESDVHPWVVPKYGSLFFIICCFEGSFSTTKLTDYLYIKDTFSTFVNQLHEAKSSGDTNIEPIKNLNTLAGKNEVFPGTPGSSRSKSGELSYKSNYDQYVKYRKLFKESNPNSTVGYYFQHVVDVLSDGIIQDIISNPLNNQINIEPQFIFPMVSHNNLHGKKGGKKNENSCGYEVPEFVSNFWSEFTTISKDIAVILGVSLRKPTALQDEERALLTSDQPTVITPPPTLPTINPKTPSENGCSSESQNSTAASLNEDLNDSTPNSIKINLDSSQENPIQNDIPTTEDQKPSPIVNPHQEQSSTGFNALDLPVEPISEVLRPSDTLDSNSMTKADVAKDNCEITNTFSKDEGIKDSSENTENPSSTGLRNTVPKFKPRKYKSNATIETISESPAKHSKSFDENSQNDSDTNNKASTIIDKKQVEKKFSIDSIIEKMTKEQVDVPADIKKKLLSIAPEQKTESPNNKNDTDELKPKIPDSSVQETRPAGNIPRIPELNFKLKDLKPIPNDTNNETDVVKNDTHNGTKKNKNKVSKNKPEISIRASKILSLRVCPDYPKCKLGSKCPYLHQFNPNSSKIAGRRRNPAKPKATTRSIGTDFVSKAIEGGITIKHGKDLGTVEKSTYKPWMSAQAPSSGVGGGRPQPNGSPNCLENITFVVTGELPGFSRDDCFDIVKRYGGRITSAVSSKTTFLVVGENPGSSKVNKAKQFNTPILDEDNFVALVELFGKTTEQKSSSESDTGENQKGSITTKRKIESDSDSEYVIKKKNTKSEIKESQDLNSVDNNSMEIDSKPENLPSIKPEPELIKTSPITDKNVPQEKQKPNEPKISNLWVDIYKPKNLSELCGNKKQVEDTINWLKHWSPNLEKGQKSLLISGPPGIGKTTAVQLIARELGLDAIEFNASDSRNKESIKNHLGVLSGNHTILEFANQKSTFKKPLHPIRQGKTLIVMDEVDGMSSGDRGGTAELIKIIEKSKIPIICICNDRASQKVKSLANHCVDIRFFRPQARMLRSRIMSICHREGLKIDANAADQLAAATQADMRQILNILSTWKLSKNSISINAPPGVGDLMMLSKAADSISEADIMDSLIRGSQNWGLLTSHAVMSSVRPSYFMTGKHLSMYNFPGWLGKNSSTSKNLRLLSELSSRMRHKVSGDRNQVRMSYIPTMAYSLTLPMVNDGVEGIDKVLEFMEHYSLTREDWDTVNDLLITPKNVKPLQSRIDTKTKSAFTRQYNKSSHKVVATAKAMIRVDKSVPDLEDIIDDLDADADIKEDTPEDSQLTETQKNLLDDYGETDKLIVMKSSSKKGSKATKPAKKAPKKEAKPRAKKSSLK